MKNSIRVSVAVLLLLSGSSWAEIPSLKPLHGKTALHVDGKPFIMLGGQVMNSSSFSLELMESVWPRMSAFHLNTLIVPISWQAVEPVEGEFDFSLVDGLLKQARKNDMHLAFLWFGCWKNARSGYVPEWVITDLKRFPRMEKKNGARLEVISNLSKNANAADARAFSAFMRHLKKVDEKKNTVLMVQVQNEIGLLGDSRDRSPAAEKAFAEPVPAELISCLKANSERLTPHLKAVWKKQNCRTAGSWADLFGTGADADEIFMAWHYARFVNRMAEAGKQEYALPMTVNAWTVDPEKPQPGKYPSGGPVAKMMDIWKAGAPAIDVLAVDNYRAEYKEKCRDFIRHDNPLFVPEACALWRGDRWTAPAKAFYTLAEDHAVGFAPFGIDHAHYQDGHPIGTAYAALEELMPLIIKYFGTDHLRGFYKEDGETETVIPFGKYRCRIKYADPLDVNYGLIIRISEDEFIAAGNGASVQFFSNDKARPGLSVCLLEEGGLVDGQWKRKRLLAGDEAMGQGTQGLNLPPLAYKLLHDKNNMSIQRIKLYQHPPRKGGAPVPFSDDSTQEGVFD